jgi:hypothetical protein
MNILLVAMRRPPGEGLSAGVEALRRRGARVDLLTRHPPADPLAAELDGVHLVPRSGPTASLGPLALPGPLRKIRLDPDRLPGAVRVHRTASTRVLFDDADVVVALDDAAIPAVWLAARRRPGLVALNGLPAAVHRFG